MEGDLATAELMARLCFAWLQFSFSPFPVGHPAHQHGRRSRLVEFSKKKRNEDSVNSEKNKGCVQGIFRHLDRMHTGCQGRDSRLKSCNSNILTYYALCFVDGSSTKHVAIYLTQSILNLNAVPKRS